MEFKNEFDVKAPIDEVYSAMLDLERVAPAMPGAEVLEKTDEDHYKVGIKVKVGPISMQYRGDVEIVDKNPDTHSATIKVAAREARGQGTANANVDMRLAEAGEGTHGEMTANVQLAGRAAAMGRGVIQDVSAKLVDTFARNLGSMLESRPAEAPEAAQTNGGAAAPAEAGSSAEAGETGKAPPSGGAQTPAGAGAAAGSAAHAQTKAGAGTEAAASGSASQQSWQPPEEDEGVDALGIAASVAADRFRDPRVLIGSLAIVILIAWLLGRRAAS
jgi:carbon monoxide dehydrogenase subunit G